MKIPQLAVRDATGGERATYFNIWRWIMGNLTPAERGGRAGESQAGGSAQVGDTFPSRR